MNCKTPGPDLISTIVLRRDYRSDCLQHHREEHHSHNRDHHRNQHRRYPYLTGIVAATIPSIS